MNHLHRIQFFSILIKTVLTWKRRDTHHAFTLPNNPKFMGPRDAVKLIPDGAVVATSGLAANQRPSILYWTIRELFEETGHPCNLTIAGTGGQGGRGRVPGTVEELGRSGLCTRLVVGHVETYKTMLLLAEKGELEIQCLPQGVIAQLFEAQGRGEDSLLTHVGINTFMDPRTGRGTPLTPSNAAQWITPEADGLRYRMPKIDVALFNAYAADSEGNIYVTHCTMKAELREIALAAKRNGGRVIANVSCIVEKNPDEIYLEGDKVDAVVVYPKTEQSGYERYNSHLTFMTLQSPLPPEEGLARARFINSVMGITPRRRAMDHVLARLAADAFAQHVHAGSLVNVGVGLPEEVCNVLHDQHVLDHVTLFSESGVFGGVPAPGIFFGAAINPERIISSAETFRMCEERLDASILGVLQADSEGNVNVSKRTDSIMRYVGPGGFIDLTTAAKTIIFVTKWMEGERMRLRGGQVEIVKRGRPKFIGHVDEVTFSGQEALKAGKTVLFATTVGLFKLTDRGMELIRVMPGIDIQRDILAVASTKIILPESGEVPRIDESIVTGKGFQLHLTS